MLLAEMKLTSVLRASKILSNGAVSVMSAILIWHCAACLKFVEAADLSVRVNSYSGVDSSSCGDVPPCQTISYAIRSRLANTLDRFFTREATMHPLRILTYGKPVMCSD